MLSWLLPDSDDVWLALDRNTNGLIDDATELFGNFTPQPDPPQEQVRNGFLALSVYDQTANGGNGDGVIDVHDKIFSELRLWRDDNHNGISEAAELLTLRSLHIEGLDLKYHEAHKTDQHGNEFRYRAKVLSGGTDIGKWAWDVFLQPLRNENIQVAGKSCTVIIEK